MFFTNSGTEANEAAFKLTRRTGRTHVVVAEGRFHGRTMGALALTSKEAYRDAVRAAARRRHLRPVRRRRRARRRRDRRDRRDPARADPGRGRRRRTARRLPRRRPRDRRRARRAALARRGADRHGPHRRAGSRTRRPASRPDIVTVAKGLGGGFPIGACIGLGDAGDLLQPGNHGTTFGGNPVACAAALAVIRTIEDDDLLEHVTVLGQKLRDGLAADPRVTEVRGEGLLIGLDLAADGVRRRASPPPSGAGFIVNNPTPTRIRLAPPLVLTEDDADAFLAAWPASSTTAMGEDVSDGTSCATTT